MSRKNGKFGLNTEYDWASKIIQAEQDSIKIQTNSKFEKKEKMPVFRSDSNYFEFPIFGLTY